MHKSSLYRYLAVGIFMKARKKEGLKPDYLNTVTIAVVVPVFTSLAGWSSEMEVFFVFMTL
jgi:hypothetical protein